MKFAKFYNGLTNTTLPILIVCLVGIIGWFAKVLSGSGLTDSDIVLVLFAAGTGIGTVVLWGVCTIIRAFQIDRHVKSGGGRIR